MNRLAPHFLRCLAAIAAVLCLLRPATAAAGQNLMPHLDDTFRKQQWNETIQTAIEILRRDPASAEARVKGAFALIQKGYPNAALALLKRMTPAQWSSVPKEMHNMVEVVALFQKKVPFISLSARMDQLNESEASTSLRDEIRFAKGRAAFEKNDFEKARTMLDQVERGSRFYGPAQYLLGTLYMKRGDTNASATAFAQVFGSQIMQQTTEFWGDIGAQDHSQFGTSVNVGMDTEALRRSNDVGELAVLATARLLYSQKKHEEALLQYAKLPANSPLYSRGRLETAWTLLVLDRHEAAAQAASELSVDENHFESLEARVVRALILTDAGKPTEARNEVLKFLEVHANSKESLTRYRQFPNPESLPNYIKGDLKDDTRVSAIAQYRTGVQEESLRLRKEDRVLYPAFYNLSNEIEPLVSQAREYNNRLIIEYVDRRLQDLDRLYIQARLIAGETYLEEREKLRAEFRGKGITVEAQDSHDTQLVKLLLQAIKEVDAARSIMKTRNLALEFRQSELLWELASASAFLKKDVSGTTGKEAYETYRAQAIQIARDLAEKYPKFDKRPQALFFVGFALMEVGNEKEGLAYLNRYVSEYPNHENVPNAYRILADVEFDANRFAKSEELYKKILQFPSSPIMGYTLYKLGWCNYSRKNYAAAMMGLEQAILWTRNLENTDHLLSLKREAARDLISIYAEVGNHKKAYEYFERFLGSADATKWLADLARELEKGGLFEKSTELYSQLLTLGPTPEERMQYQTAMIFGAYQLRDWNLVLEKTRELVNGFGSILEAEQVAESPSFRTEKILNEIVLAQHFEFDQYAKDADTGRILAIDELYLKAFSKWKSSQMPQYQYAHYQLKYKRVKEAAVAFTRHWEQFRTELKEPLKEESLRNLVHAIETVDQIKEEEPDPAATEMRVDNLVKYATEYAQLYPSTKHSRAIAFLKTVALMKHGRTEQGIVETQKVFDQNPNDDFGNRAFKNLRVAYYNIKDWKRTYDWATEILARPGIEKSTHLADLKTVREEALFLLADGTKENVQAADLYTKIAEDPQMLRLRPKALYNAFVQLKEAGKRTEAMNTAIKLEQAAPNAPEVQNISGVRAAYYQEAGDYERALPLYERFLKAPPKDTPIEALDQVRLSTALISEAMGKTSAAAQLYATLVAPREKPSALQADAQRGIDRLKEITKRQPASANPPAFPKGEALLNVMAELERNPLAKSKDLAAKIQGGAQKLEKAIRQFLEVSGDPGTPSFHAFETYCAVPFLYTYYQTGVRSLGKDQPDELIVELEKIASPLDAKSSEMAEQCLSRTTEAFHDGPMYRKVLQKWGWVRHPTVVAEAKKIRGSLNSLGPWIEPLGDAPSEEQILKSHLDEKATNDSWYQLARHRMNAKKPGLARLTFLTALSKDPDSGRILNAMALLRQAEGADIQTLDALFKKAAEKGSAMAYANLAQIHINGARLSLTVDALVSAEKGGAFKDKPELETALSAIRSALENP